MNRPSYRTKYGLDTAVAIIFMMVGVCTVSAVFGMLLFPIFTHVCAEELLVAVAKIGYAGIIVLGVGVLLEAYNLYEHHRHHVAVLIAATFVLAVIATLLIHFATQAYTCQL